MPLKYSLFCRKLRSLQSLKFELSVLARSCPSFCSYLPPSLSLYASIKLLSRKLNWIQGFNFETLLLVCLTLKHMLLHDNVSHLIRWSYLIIEDDNRIYVSIHILYLFLFMPSFCPRPSFLFFICGFAMFQGYVIIQASPSISHDPL